MRVGEENTYIAQSDRRFAFVDHLDGIAKSG